MPVFPTCNCPTWSCQGWLQKQLMIDNNANLGLLALLLIILEKDPCLYNCSKLKCKYKWLCRECHNHASTHEMPDLTVDVRAVMSCALPATSMQHG